MRLRRTSNGDGEMRMNFQNGITPFWEQSTLPQYGLSTWLYRQRGMAVNAVSQDSFSIAKYVIQGIVKDDEGNPVEGAALHNGKEVVLPQCSSERDFRLLFSTSKTSPVR